MGKVEGAREASRSTGPRSPQGKRRSSRNAFKHGLSIPLLHDPDLAPEVQALARRIAGDKDEVLGIASRIAEAELDLLRVRRLRSELIDRSLQAPIYMSGSDHPKFGGLLGRVLSDQLRASDEQRLCDVVRENETRPERHARVLADLAKELARLDRYERRALSRRKSAIRQFDSSGGR